MPSKTTIKSELACLELEKRAIDKGAIVSRPNIECEYDRIVDYDGTLYRVQVKYASSLSSHSSGAVQANVGKAGKKKGTHIPYEKDDIDVVVIYIPQTEQLCWFDRECWIDKIILNIRFEPTKNGQSRGCRMADDYDW